MASKTFMSKCSLDDVRRFAVDSVVHHPHDLSKRVSEKFHISRQQASRLLSKLVSQGWLSVSGAKTRPMHGLGLLRVKVCEYDIPGIDETVVWVNDFAPWIQAKKNVIDICHYGFTEMLNNANDHSGGSKVKVIMHQSEDTVFIGVSDNGMGIFEKISNALELPDRRLALLELAKGKLTTDPSHHSGEGIFFTSRLFDRFNIHANGLNFKHDIEMPHDWLWEADSALDGTFVSMAISINSDKTTKSVFDEFAVGDSYSFDKTIVPVKLAKIGNENLVSRSQAKRLTQRFDRFRIVILDFQDVHEIGQGFSDELFRVFTNANPEIQLIPVNTSKDIDDMIKRVQN